MLHCSCGVQHSSSDPFFFFTDCGPTRTALLMLPFVVWTCYIVSTCQLTLTVASTHFPHHTNAMTVIRCHPNVCGALAKIPMQTFRDVTSIQQFLVGPSNSVFFSTYSSYRLDKINSDMRNYITNFAADLRWIQVQLLPLPLCCCHVAAVRCQSQLARRPADIFNMDALQSKHSRPVNERSPGAICSYCQSTRQWCTQCRFDFSCCPLHQRAFRVFFKYSAKNKICGACTTTFTLNRWVFLPQHVFGCSESWYYFANTQGLATASQDGLGDF